MCLHRRKETPTCVARLPRCHLVDKGKLRSALRPTEAGMHPTQKEKGATLLFGGACTAHQLLGSTSFAR